MIAIVVVLIVGLAIKWVIPPPVSAPDLHHEDETDEP
jgi:hypothetical protein